MKLHPITSLVALFVLVDELYLAPINAKEQENNIEQH